MITIIQQPQPINYSQSIPDLLMSTDQAYILVEITDSVTGLFVEERYDTAPAGTPTRVRLRELLDDACRAYLPDGTAIVSAYPDAINTIQVKYKDDDGTTWNAIEFKVLKGFAHPQEFDITNFLATKWLTPMPKFSQVYYHQPLFLSLYHTEPLLVFVDAAMADGTSKSIQIGATVANILQTVNINPGMIKGMLGGDYKYFEVYTKHSTGVLRHHPYRFYYDGTYRHQADVFVYLNRLGGFDTIVMNGERKDKYNTQDKLARIDRRDIAYHQDHTFSMEKNSGYIGTSELRRQHIDFAQSSQRYYLHDGALIPIHIENIDLSLVFGKANEYNFTFKPADVELLRPALGFNTHYINI